LQEVSEKVTVSLMGRNDYVVFEKTVILYEGENFLVTTPLSYFLSYMVIEFHFGYDQLLPALEKIINDGQRNNLLRSFPYVTNPNWRDHVNEGRVNFALAHFLEQGTCFFYDKKRKNNVKHVVVEYWGYSPAPLAGAGGRRFYINNILFFETTDWIS